MGNLVSNFTSENHNRYITELFDSISARYDLLNRLLSFGIDRRWRTSTITHLQPYNPQFILDMATGTADMAITMAKSFQNSNVIGIDIAPKMIDVGRNKIIKCKLNNRIELQLADGHHLPFENNIFDAATNAFGLRNFANPQLGVNELFRTVKNGGKVIILEFTAVKNNYFRKIYSFYFNHILPFTGRIISKHKTAYSYLPFSIDRFNSTVNPIELLRNAGFIKIEKKILSFGVASIITGVKP